MRNKKKVKEGESGAIVLSIIYRVYGYFFKIIQQKVTLWEIGIFKKVSVLFGLRPVSTQSIYTYSENIHIFV